MSKRASAQEQTSLAAHRDKLLDVAGAAIDHGLEHGRPPRLDPSAYDAALQAHRAAFVTLLDGNGELRGCIGSIEAQRPLVADVAANAFAAAFQDPRFPPLTRAERDQVTCKLSVLTPPEPMAFDDEGDLLRQLAPGVDGVLIEAGRHRGTLLPQVWDHIADPTEFWLTVKRKAGLAPDAWPEDLRVYRYRTEQID
jgi:AmmeMemoRadiSam system protein A